MQKLLEKQSQKCSLGLLVAAGAPGFLRMWGTHRGICSTGVLWSDSGIVGGDFLFFNF